MIESKKCFFCLGASFIYLQRHLTVILMRFIVLSLFFVTLPCDVAVLSSFFIPQKVRFLVMAK